MAEDEHPTDSKERNQILCELIFINNGALSCTSPPFYCIWTPFGSHRSVICMVQQL